MNKAVIILFLLSLTVSAQTGQLSGRVMDENGQPIIGANVLLENTLYGTATDSKGNYRFINLPSGNYIISVSIIGYSKSTSSSITIDQEIQEINFTLKPTSYQFDQLVITANKYSQDMREIAATGYVLDQKIFSQKNFQKIDDALRYVPGVAMTFDQISIRGSSGYSRGAGTRVLVALDGIPIYTPDSGDIIWELVPVSEIGRVEIIKGSASSLYGSSAIGGVVNIISKEISSNPVTFFKAQGGFYSKPSHSEWEWTDKTLSFNSQTISHSRSIGKLSFAASFTRFEDYSYRQNDYQLRFAGYLKAKYQFSEATTLSILATGYTRDRNTFIYWRNIENALSPPEEDIGQFTNSDRTIVGMTLNHIFNDKLSISFIPSAYVSYWKDDSQNSNKSSSKLYRSELRTNYNFSNKLKLVSGAEFQYNDVTSNIFGNNNAIGLGLYSQADYKPMENINLSMGLRFDHNQLAELESSMSLSPKLGITYKISPATYLRGQVSKGFRAPTLAEAFTSTTTSGITVKPNPNLESETSYSMEVGANHIFNDFLSLDLSLFNNEYYEMIEPGFDPNDGELFFNNVTRARIQGVDISSSFSLLQHLFFKLGYTYLWARDIENDKTLNYRPKHNVMFGLNFEKSIYEIGLDLRYLSKVENIDIELVDLGIIPDGDNRVEIIVLDAHVGVNLFAYNIPCRLFVNANNLLNYNYVELIGNIAPIRNFSLNAEFIF